MSANMRPSEEELHAYIDGELDEAQAAAVESAMQDDAELARQMHAYRADKVRLQQIYNPLIDRPLPQAWLDSIANRNVVALPAATSRRRAVGWALAASVAAAVGVTFALRRTLEPNPDAMVAAALSAHAGASGIPAQPIPEGALQEIVGVAVQAPDLSKLGFSLVGMRRQDGPGGKTAAVLAYRDAGERVFTLYLQASGGTPAFDMIKRGETRICLWQDDVLSAIMLADISAAEMLRLASLAYSGLNA